jgi:hypothetical protein
MINNAECRGKRFFPRYNPIKRPQTSKRKSL